MWLLFYSTILQPYYVAFSSLNILCCLLCMTFCMLLPLPGNLCISFHKITLSLSECIGWSVLSHWSQHDYHFSCFLWCTIYSLLPSLEHLNNYSLWIFVGVHTYYLLPHNLMSSVNAESQCLVHGRHLINTYWMSLK
jgi:hypothetical protein